MDVVKGVRNVNAALKRLVDPKACQFLVNYSFLVVVPSNLRRNLSFVTGEIEPHTFPGRKTSTVAGIRLLHSSVGNKAVEIASGGTESTASDISEGRRGVLAQISLRGGSSSPCAFPFPSEGIVSRGTLTMTFLDF
jgi:riboflavin synthase